jgi:hypothetical protein
MTALAENEQSKVVEVVGEVAAVVARAQALEIRTPQEAQEAAGFLGEIATARKKSETARRFLVDPLNRHVKAINDEFKSAAAPLEEADKVVRAKVISYQREQERARAEEQARIDAERRAAEEAAEAERRRQADEAARLERQAREAEQARQAQLREAQNERAREIAAMSDDDLSAFALRTDDQAELRLAEQEMSARLARRQAQEVAETARRQSEEATQREIAAKSAPAVEVTSSKPAGVATRKVWKATVVDPMQVPREYLAVDQAALNAAVRAGIREIAGVRIEQVDQLAVGAK